MTGTKQNQESFFAVVIGVAPFERIETPLLAFCYQKEFVNTVPHQNPPVSLDIEGDMLLVT